MASTVPEPGAHGRIADGGSPEASREARPRWSAQGVRRRVGHVSPVSALPGRFRCTAGDSGALARYAPYAMIFGLAAPVLPTGSAREPPGAAGPRAQTADFAARWQKAWATAAPSGTYWSEPLQPGHSAVPGRAYDQHIYDHHGGGFDGGHGGGFHGGHL